MEQVDPNLQKEFQAQSALQQQAIQAEQGMNAPAIVQQQQQLQAALVEQTNPSHVLEEVELKLKGYRQKYDGSFVKNSEPLMNSKGIARVIFILSSIVNQNTILSHLEAAEIGRLIVQVSDDLIDDLVLNWKEYGIYDKILLDSLINVILIPCFMSLKRAWKQNEKNWLNKAVVESINTTQRPLTQKKEGFFNRLKL